MPASDVHAHMASHIVEITASDPPWLPEPLRGVAQGEFTFLCPRCNAYPDIKWPSEGGAASGMQIHLAVAHTAGRFADMGGALAGGPVRFGMVSVA